MKLFQNNVDRFAGLEHGMNEACRWNEKQEKREIDRQNEREREKKLTKFLLKERRFVINRSIIINYIRKVI